MEISDLRQSNASEALEVPRWPALIPRHAVLRTETSEARQVLKEQIALQAIPASVFQL